MVSQQTRNAAREAFTQFLKSVRHSVIKYRKNANTKDIIETLEHAFPEAVKLTKNIAPYFTIGHHLRNLDPDLNTAYNVWRFLKLWIRYEKDEPNRQDIRKPNFFAFSRKGDCKSFSLFAASVLANLGFKVSFRYTAYRPGIPYKHVYVVATKNGKEYIVDAVYKLFNEEKPYIAVKTNQMDTYILGDVSNGRPIRDPRKLQMKINRAYSTGLQKIVRSAKFKAMPRAQQIKYLANFKRRAQSLTAKRLAGMDGVDGVSEIGKLHKRKKKSKAEKKAARKKRNARIKRNLAKVGRGILTVGLGAGRGAFLAIVAMNLNGMASKMKALQDKNKFAEFYKKWKNLGGIKKLLDKAIKAGAKHKPLFLSKKAKRKFAKMGLHGICDEGLGAIPVAAVAAAAAPVLAALLPLLAKMLKGAGLHQDAQQVEAGAESVAEEGTPIVDQELEETGGDAQDYEPEPGEPAMDESAGDDGGDESAGDDGGDGGDGGDESAGDDDAEVGAVSEIWGELGKLAGKAVGAITRKIKKKNPKAGKVLGKIGQGVDDYAAGVYLRKSGYRKAAEDFGGTIKRIKSSDNLPIILGATGIGAAIIFGMSRRR